MSGEDATRDRVAIQTAGAPPAIGPYSQAIRTGSLVFLSGQIPIDPSTGQLVTGGIAAETRQVLDNLGAVLSAAGSSFGRVVKATVYLVDMADFPAMNEGYAAYFPASAPARATVAVSALPRGARIEIDLIAQ